MGRDAFATKIKRSKKPRKGGDGLGDSFTSQLEWLEWLLTLMPLQVKFNKQG